jgi:hypothetical protein
LGNVKINTAIEIAFALGTGRPRNAALGCAATRQFPVILYIQSRVPVPPVPYVGFEVSRNAARESGIRPNIFCDWASIAKKSELKKK